MKKESRKTEAKNMLPVSDQEQALSYVYPVRLGRKKKQEINDDLMAVLAERRLKRAPEEKLKASLLQLRFKIEDYLKKNEFDKEKTFGFFLRLYIQELNKKQKDFAEEIDVKPAELSGYLNNHRTPPERVIIRLEIHSHNTIPAIDWYQLVEKGKMHELSTNKHLRIAEQKFVKRKAALA